MRLAFLAAIAASILFLQPASAHSVKVGQLELTDLWTRATPPNAPTAGGYLTITNTGDEADRLVAVSSPEADDRRDPRDEGRGRHHDHAAARRRSGDSAACDRHPCPRRIPPHVHRPEGAAGRGSGNAGDAHLREGRLGRYLPSRQGDRRQGARRRRLTARTTRNEHAPHRPLRHLGRRHRPPRRRRRCVLPPRQRRRAAGRRRDRGRPVQPRRPDTERR